MVHGCFVFERKAFDVSFYSLSLHLTFESLGLVLRRVQRSRRIDLLHDLLVFWQYSSSSGRESLRRSIMGDADGDVFWFVGGERGFLDGRRFADRIRQIRLLRAQTRNRRHFRLPDFHRTTLHCKLELVSIANDLHFGLLMVQAISSAFPNAQNGVALL